MALKIVSSLFLGTLVLYCCPLTQTKGQPVYIKAEKSNVILLDENYFEVSENKKKLFFTFGMDHLEELNMFTHTKEKDKERIINKIEANKIKFSSIESLNSALKANGFWDNPNDYFKEIYIVFFKENSTIIYEVCWEKYTVLE